MLNFLKRIFGVHETKLDPARISELEKALETPVSNIADMQATSNARSAKAKEIAKDIERDMYSLYKRKGNADDRMTIIKRVQNALTVLEKHDIYIRYDFVNDRTWISSTKHEEIYAWLNDYENKIRGDIEKKCLEEKDIILGEKEILL
jgi:hypothetical protein